MFDAFKLVAEVFGILSFSFLERLRHHAEQA